VASAAEERRGEGLRRAVAASLMIMVFHKESEGNAMSNFTIDHGTVDGQTIAQWTQDWWTWALNLPIKHSGASNPFQDPSGGSASAGQSGPVFFLQSNTSQNNVYVPAGIHHFLVPLVNFIDTAPEAFPPHPDSITPVIAGPNSIHSTEARNISSFDRSVTHLFAMVGGVAIPEKRTIFSSCGQFLFRSRDRAAKHTCNGSVRGGSCGC